MPGMEGDRVLLPSAIVVLRALELASRHRLTARRIQDAHHVAAALVHGVVSVYTYHREDWTIFQTDGLRTVGPPTTLARLSKPI